MATHQYYEDMIEQNVDDTKVLAKALLDVLNMLYIMDRIECGSMLKEYADSLLRIIGNGESHESTRT